MIYRNLVGDYGIDYLHTAPGRSYEQQSAGGDGGFSVTGLIWHELVRIADNHGPAADGVKDSAARLLLVLPLFNDLDVPQAGLVKLSAALIVAGAPQDTAPDTAENLLTHLTGRPRHDPTWGSPLSGSKEASPLQSSGL